MLSLLGLRNNVHLFALQKTLGVCQQNPDMWWWIVLSRCPALYCWVRDTVSVRTLLDGKLQKHQKFLEWQPGSIPYFFKLPEANGIKIIRLGLFDHMGHVFLREKYRVTAKFKGKVFRTIIKLGLRPEPLKISAGKVPRICNLSSCCLHNFSFFHWGSGCFMPLFGEYAFSEHLRRSHS